MIIVNFGEKHLDLLEEVFRRMKLLEDFSPNKIARRLFTEWNCNLSRVFLILPRCHFDQFSIIELRIVQAN